MASKMNKVKCSRAPARLAAHKSRATSGRVSHPARGSALLGRHTGAPRVSQLSLIRTFAAQTEALQRYRGKGQQKVTVEHVHVHTGGQAIVGAVSQSGGGRENDQNRGQPHAPETAGAITFEPGTTLPRADKARDVLPVASGRR